MIDPTYIDFETITFAGSGSISVARISEGLPFDVKRIFWTYQTPADVIRGRHAHHRTVQVLIAVAGTIHVELTAASGEKKHFTLDSPGKGLLIPPHFWHQMRYSEDAVQLVLASTAYEEADYIRDFNQFQQTWGDK